MQIRFDEFKYKVYKSLINDMNRTNVNSKMSKKLPQKLKTNTELVCKLKKTKYTPASIITFMTLSKKANAKRIKP